MSDDEGLGHHGPKARDRIDLNPPAWTPSRANEYALRAQVDTLTERCERMDELFSDVTADVAERNARISTAGHAIMEWGFLRPWDKFWSAGAVLRRVQAMLSGSGE